MDWFLYDKNLHRERVNLTLIDPTALCGSFRRAPPKIKNIYYQDTKEKDQKIFSHMACFCHTGVTFEQY